MRGWMHPTPPPLIPAVDDNDDPFCPPPPRFVLAPVAQFGEIKRWETKYTDKAEKVCLEPERNACMDTSLGYYPDTIVRASHCHHVPFVEASGDGE